MTPTNDFRDLVVSELAAIVAEHGCDRTERHAVKVAEAIADRLTCTDCGFIDIGLNNPPDNVCNDCAPRHQKGNR